MKKIRVYIAGAFLAMGMIFSPVAGMASEQNHRGSSQSSSSRGSQSRSSQSSSRGSSSSNRGSSSSSRGNNGNHRGSSSGNSTSSNRPQNNGSSSRPGGNGGNNNQNNNGNRPGNNGNQNNNGNRPGNNGNQNNNGNRPGNSGNHNGNNQGNRPGGNGNHNGNKPGSAPRPGAGGSYHPVNPHPPVCQRPDYGYRWTRPLPPAPPRYTTVRVGAPTINAILGLTFGSLINYGIDQLLGAGYTVVGTYDDAIYLSNVNRFGVIWREVTMYYGTAGLNGARFQSSTLNPNAWTYNSAYRSLCNTYGRPVSVTTTGGVRQAVWWGGSYTGYVTLSYGPGTDQYGSPLYYTDLVYGM